MRGISANRCGRVDKHRVGTCFGKNTVSGSSIVNGIVMMCCCARRNSDVTFKVGAARTDLLATFVGGHRISGLLIARRSGKIFCPVARVPPKGSGLTGFI